MFTFSDVDRWDGYIYKRYGGEDKARWLVSLSIPGPIDFERRFIFCTTTTVEKIDIIQQNKYFKLDKSKYNFFYCDCFVYFTEPVFDLLESEINKNINSIQCMGRITPEDMVKLYFGYWSNRMGSPFLLRMIKDCYIRNGISSSILPDPRKNL